MIANLDQLYAALDVLLSGISRACSSCTHDDCRGYIWLMPEEEEPLYEAGVEILQVNESKFINPFLEGPIDVEIYKPPCPWRENGLCSIHEKRPLFCRLFPLDFSCEGGIVHVVLQLDCAWSAVQNKSFKQKAQRLFSKMNPDLLKRVVDTWLGVENLSKYPYGPNRSQVLFPLGRYPA